MSGDGVVKLIVALVSAIVALFVTNKLVKDKTGKGIAEHAYDWYSPAREDVLAWARENGKENVIGITVWLDNRASELVRLVFKGRTSEAEVQITETTVSLEEALEMFPELASADFADLTPMTLEA